MNPVQVQAMIDAALNEYIITLPLISGVVPNLTINAPVSGFTPTMLGGRLQLLQTTPGADRVGVYSFAILPQTSGEGPLSVFDTLNGSPKRKICRIESYVGLYLNTNPGDDDSNSTELGIAMSWMDGTPPYFSPSDSDKSAALLCYRPATQTFHLRIWRGATSIQGLFELNIPLTDATAPDTTLHGFHLKLVNDPFNETLKAYVDGVLCATVEGVDYPRWDVEISDLGVWASVYIQSGSGASTRIGGTFSNSLLGIKDPHGPISPAHA
jgi:hypothetical protein